MSYSPKRGGVREITLQDPDDRDFRVRYEFDPGEEQWFDARAGVGSPGYPAEVSVIEVDFGAGWESPDVYPQLNMDAIEQACIDNEERLAQDYWAGVEELEHQRYAERSSSLYGNRLTDG